MLPYSPLHHLLLADAGVHAGDDERQRLRRADRVRRRATRASAWGRSPTCCSSTTGRSRRAPTTRSCGSCTAGGGMFLRRSRGYVPAAVCRCPSRRARPMLACGAELKNTFCVAKGERAWVVHHIGDLENYETLRSFTDGIEHFERLFAVAPEVVAHDLHPEYLSTKYALERDGVELDRRPAPPRPSGGVLAEHGEPGPAVGAIFDGTGTAPTGRVWGGELLVGDLARLPARRGAAAGAAAGRRARRSASRGGWRARGWRRRVGETARRPARAGSGTVDAEPWEQVCRLARDRDGLAADHERRAAVRRRRRAVRDPRARSTTRARRRSSSRPRAIPTERGRVPDRRHGRGRVR